MRTMATLLQEQYRDGANLEARIALHARFSTAKRQFHDWLFDHIAAPPDARILELGCGTGAMWQTVHPRVPRTWRLMLTDFSAGMVNGARPQMASRELAARFAQCDAQAIPFPAETFDAVIANHMLYHVPDLTRGIAEISRVLKPGGRLYAATNGDNHLREMDELAAGAGLPHLKIWQLTFRLENGAELLAPHFADVQRFDFADTLVVSEAEPLVAYIASMNVAAGLMTESHRQNLRELITQRLARESAIHIRKETGLFVACK